MRRSRNVARLAQSSTVMPRNIPVGNGEMLVTFDDLYRIRDVYWPRVGMPNHTAGHVQRFGIWVDGHFAWIDDAGWSRTLRYRRDTLVTDVVLRHEALAIELRCADAVDYSWPVFLRRVEAFDLAGRAREVRVFFHQDLSVDGSPVGDTVIYDPATHGLIHYKDRSYFLFNACNRLKCGIDRWATGAKRIGDAEGTWRDAEDGSLGGSAIAQGSVDSVVGVNLSLSAGGSDWCVLWMAAGTDQASVRRLNQRVQAETAVRLIERTDSYWRTWTRKEPVDYAALPDELVDLFHRSQVIVRTQIDAGGAIIAANDSDITHFAGDTYSYMWPRDGALVASALVLAGHGELSRRFFRFAAKVIEPDGYFLHKYNPNGTLASSWHPWILDGQRVLPIQQDETALVIWALRRHYLVFRDVEFIKEVHEELIVRAGNWLLAHRDPSGLPKPSWDLWEERRGVHLFTVASVIGALDALTAFSRDFGRDESAKHTEDAANRMRTAMIEHLWSEQDGRFARTATPRPDGSYALDMTVDASAYGLFAFGALSARDPKVMAQMDAVRDRLWVRTETGGVARYENDPYHQVERQDVETVPGNPWVICTLWLAQHEIAAARDPDELRGALRHLDWARRRAAESGVLAEQYDPYGGGPLSVSPLTWSHATVMTVVMEYLLRHARLTGRGCGSLAELAVTEAR